MRLDNSLQDLSNLDEGIQLFDEHNCDTKKSKVREGVGSILLKYWPVFRKQFSVSATQAQTYYLPSGISTITLGSWTGRLLPSKVDPINMGWCPCMNLRGKGDKVVRVYSAHRVPQYSLSDPHTTYSQQYKMMT